MKKSFLAILILALVGFIVPSCNNAYDEAEQELLIDETGDPNTGSDSDGPQDVPPGG